MLKEKSKKIFCSKYRLLLIVLFSHAANSRNSAVFIWPGAPFGPVSDALAMNALTVGSVHGAW